MKGIVFTEFLDMVDSTYGVKVTEEIIAMSNLESKGAYTAIGTYSHSEIVSLVSNLSALTGQSVNELIKVFGTHLMSRFSVMFPKFFVGASNVTDFLEQVDGYIHREVRRLYPDATLPKLQTSTNEDGHFVLTYKSDRMMGDLAEGLLAGAISHFGNTHHFHRNNMNNEGGKQCIQFTLIRNSVTN